MNICKHREEEDHNAGVLRDIFTTEKLLLLEAILVKNQFEDNDSCRSSDGSSKKFGADDLLEVLSLWVLIPSSMQHLAARMHE